MDCSFILKRDTGRGLVGPQDLIDQKDSHIFKPRTYLSEQISQPKLSVMWCESFTTAQPSTSIQKQEFKDMNEYYKENREVLKNKIILSLSLVSKKKILNHELKERAKSVEDNYKDYRSEDTHFIFKDAEYDEINSRIDALLSMKREKERLTIFKK